MRKRIVAGNWKMNLGLAEALELASKFSGMKKEEVILATPFVYLHALAQNAKGYTLSAQDCSAHAAGAYTGEVSAAMLASIGVSHCIVGHSERRQLHGETDALVAAKTDRLLENKLTPIVCCGEKLEQRNAGVHRETVIAQLEHSLFHLPAPALASCIVAYEPVWAIGTGVTATAAQAQEMHAWIRERFAQHYTPAIADDLTILYGGSVTAANAAELFACPDVDGGLVGGASLKANDFIAIARSLHR